jgi:hypothetical protein
MPLDSQYDFVTRLVLPVTSQLHIRIGGSGIYDPHNRLLEHLSVEFTGLEFRGSKSILTEDKHSDRCVLELIVQSKIFAGMLLPSWVILI